MFSKSEVLIKSPINEPSLFVDKIFNSSKPASFFAALVSFLVLSVKSAILSLSKPMFSPAALAISLVLPNVSLLFEICCYK